MKRMSTSTCKVSRAVEGSIDRLNARLISKIKRWLRARKKGVKGVKREVISGPHRDHKLAKEGSFARDLVRKYHQPLGDSQDERG
jgi:hypothetical protein